MILRRSRRWGAAAILLIRREAGQLSAASRRDLSVLVPLLNRFTLIEFKGPTDTFEPGDLAQLAGCALLWHSQQAERVPQAGISLIVLAPSVNEAVREELRCLGWEISEHAAGGPSDEQAERLRELLEQKRGQ